MHCCMVEPAVNLVNNLSVPWVQTNITDTVYPYLIVAGFSDTSLSVGGELHFTLGFM